MEQLESIVLMRDENTFLLARDDGSTDRSSSILVAFSEKYDWCEIAKNSGLRLGITDSYLSLIDYAISKEPDLIAFCDQDDVWLSNRFEDAKRLLVKSIPQMLIGSIDIVDADLNLISKARRIVQPINPYLSIFANQAIGCASIINFSLALELSKSREYFSKEILHDWRSFILASFYGEVRYSEIVWLQYRQHGKNAIGYSIGLKRFLRYFLGNKKRLASDFHELSQNVLEYRMPEISEHLDFLIQTGEIEKRSFVERVLYISKWEISRPDFLGRVATWSRILFPKRFN